MNNKGLLADFPEKIMLIFSLSFVVVIAYLIVGTMNTVVQAEEAFEGEAQTFFADFDDRFPKNFDGMIATVFFGMMIVLIGIVWFLATNPVLFFIVWIITVVTMGLSGFLANAWVTVMESGALAPILASFPFTNFILSNYLIFTVAEAFIMITVFFAKRQAGDGM